MTQHFWNTDRIERFRQNLSEIKGCWGFSDDVLVTLIDRHVPTDKYGALNARTLGRFLRAETSKPKADNLDIALVGISGHLIQSEANNAFAELELAILNIYQEYSVSRSGERDSDIDIAIEKRGGKVEPKRLDVTVPNTSDRRSVIRHRSLSERKNELRQFLNYLDLDADASSNIARRFFRADERKCHFNTYRFSASTAKITKSFTVLHRMDPALPMVRFANFLVDNGHLRVARGICLRFHDEVAFIGNLGSGSSLKVMTFENANSPIDVYRGLLFTNDSQHGALASKFIMKRTDKTDHQEAKTGELNLTDALKEISTDEIDAMRNVIDFTLERPVFDKTGKPVSQNTIVAEVARLTAGDGDWLLKDQDGNPFNPASDVHYTFNSALLRRIK